MRKIGSVMVLSAVVTITGLGLSHLFNKQFLPKPLQVGEPAPLFDGLTLSGRKFSSMSLKGRKYLVLFFSVNCPRCQEHLPRLKETFAKFSMNNVTPIAVSLSSIHKTETFLSRHSLDLQCVVDKQKRISRAFGIRAVPALYVVNEDGKICARYRGDQVAGLQLPVKGFSDYPQVGSANRTEHQ